MSYSYYAIKSKNYIFRAIIIDIEEGDLMKITFGGEKECIHITIYKYEPYPNLDALSYKLGCAIIPETGLEKGEGTIEMIKASMQFIKELCRDKEIPIDGFLFKDQSFLIEKKTQIPLDTLNFAKYGQTWYQRTFNAIPVKEYNNKYILDINLVRRLEALNKYMTISKYKYKTNYQDFYKKNIYTSDKNIPIETQSKLEKILEPIYNSNNTYREFINEVNKKYSIVVFNYWLENFIRSKDVLNQSQNWLIPIQELDSYSSIKYSVLKKPFEFSQTGGHKLTRNTRKNIMYL